MFVSRPIDQGKPDRQLSKDRRARIIQPVIMCGGAGARLWPTSRDSLPKQFAPLLGARSSFQETALRVRGPQFSDRLLVVTSRAHRFLAEEQLAEIGVEADILLEPERRDSGPAIVAACVKIAREDPDAPVLVVAADHMISDAEAFRAAVISAREAAAAGWLVTFGIMAAHPATEYGYIEPGEPVEGAAFRVATFVEKPDARTAAGYVLAGFLWNSGNFLFTARRLIDEYAAFAPAAVEAVTRAMGGAANESGALALEPAAWGEVEKKSIDYAVMQHTARAAVVKVACGWSDIGNWDALWSMGARDAQGNAIKGDVEILDSHGCFVSSDGPLTSVLGASDLIVVAERDAILVADRRRAPEVKQLVEALRRKGRPEADCHSRVRRPWGSYQVIDCGDQFQVKRITVHPNGRLSLQKHRRRSEHWVVVSGLAQVTVEDKTRSLGPNEHVHIPLGAVHRLENFGDMPVQLIEVQSGNYLGEDDIVRLEDAYHRC
jgi:mannose-1-phosphate guanylyltransferase / mannose-6-phosphate isomerase